MQESRRLTWQMFVDNVMSEFPSPTNSDTVTGLFKRALRSHSRESHQEIQLSERRDRRYDQGVLFCFSERRVTTLTLTEACRYCWSYPRRDVSRRRES